jgi:hypothetical protein
VWPLWTASQRGTSMPLKIPVRIASLQQTGFWPVLPPWVSQPPRNVMISIEKLYVNQSDKSFLMSRFVDLIACVVGALLVRIPGGIVAYTCLVWPVFRCGRLLPLPVRTFNLRVI